MQEGFLRNCDVNITPLVKEYDFIVNGYKVCFRLQPKETGGQHIFDILQEDLTAIIEILARMERPSPGEPIKLLEGVTVLDVINGKEQFPRSP